MKNYINPQSEQFFAFNVWDFSSAKAVIDAASLLDKNVILQTSMKAFSLLERLEFRNFVSSYSSKKHIQVFLHLDHCKEEELFSQAINAGWDSVMIDASDKSLEENIRLTNHVCEISHKYNILVEAEIGHIAGAEDGINVTQEGLADIGNVEYFIRNAQMDFLAVAIGTAHGLYHGKPSLHYELLEQTNAISDIPLVIHGGTGLSDDVFIKLLSYPNVKKINISTDVKQAYREGIIKSYEKSLLEKEGFDPLKVVKNINESIRSMATHYLNLQKQKDTL